jgi:hypothetical protein
MAGIALNPGAAAQWRSLQKIGLSFSVFALLAGGANTPRAELSITPHLQK